MATEAKPAGQDTLKIIIAGGGTGGHLYPGLAIADEIRRLRPDAAITFVGTRRGIEGRVVPASGYAFVTIWISGFRRAFSLSTLLFPIKLLFSLVQSLVLLRHTKPDVVVGTGGYVCGPVVYAATVLGIQTVIQEQNSYPGVTTRLLASRVDEVHISFEATRRFLRRTENVLLTGNPTRSGVGGVHRDEAIRLFGIDPGKQTLLVFGGSQGLVAVNSAVLAALPEIIGTGVQVIWQTGERDFERINSVPAVRDAMKRGVVHMYRYIDTMAAAYAASDLVISRAGATTVAELMRSGKPAILIPLPTAAANHQTENAGSMVDAGAAVMIPEAEAGNRLAGVVRELLREGPKLSAMGEKAGKLGKADAAHVVATAVIRRAGR